MNFFRRQLYIYPQIQRPLILFTVISAVTVGVVQSLLIVAAMKWLEAKTGFDMSLVVDYRILGWWSNLLYLAVCVPIFVNLLLGFYLVLYVSNRFAGPLYRLERELDQYIENSLGHFKVNFRDSDYLKPLADKVTKAVGTLPR